MPGRPPARLRHRLFLTFLAFSAAPSLLLAALAYRTLDASLELWRTPAVSRALEGSLGVARQLLSERRPALEDDLDTLIAASAAPARGALPGGEAPDAPGADREVPATGISPAGLARSPFDAVAVAPARRPDRARWLVKPGRTAPHGVLERRLHSMVGDTLVVAGPQHLALVHVDGARRWTAMTPLPPGVQGPLTNIIEAQAFYDELEDYRRVARGGLLLGTLGILTLVIVLSWLAASALAQGVTRPLESLARAMGALSRGEAGEPVAGGGFEVRELAAAFEAMRADLESSRRNLARAERAAAWREVARRIAHEIKNPLTPVKLAVHRLRGLEEKLEPAERDRLSESLDSVDREVESLRRMADAFSRFSRLPEPDRRPADVAAVVRSVAEMYEGGRMRLAHAAPEGLTARVDEGQLRQALHNLIQNASDATRGAGPVWVEAAAETRRARTGFRLRVRDGGPGFGTDALERAGEPYFTEKTHGTGLGLAMVRRIAEAHGGEVTLGNEAGGGARVDLWIPLEEDA
ncbi:MAG: HAMP domain-containing protein [Candidatus Eisenbacteria bacterium]|nr:HAMP domain-containing protein [Candidatus Eisenbacteria bacterium]